MTGSTHSRGEGDGPVQSPCDRYACSKCCYETEMTLSEEDIRVILEKGHLEFTRLVDGYRCLVNVDGACFFLENGRCSIYEYRPLGCRLYPVIFDEEQNCAIMDDFCPYGDMFRIEPWHQETLARAIATEDRERLRRISASLFSPRE